MKLEYPLEFISLNNKIYDRVFYEKAWYAVDYVLSDYKLSFVAWKINGLDDFIEKSDLDDSMDISGSITWDLKLSLQCDTYWQNKDYLDQFNLLIMEIIRFAKSIPYFIIDDSF